LQAYYPFDRMPYGFGPVALMNET
jgi:hypothetical protein